MMKSLVYVAFHKPYGVVCQFSGEKPEETLAHFNLPKDIYPVGRLDKDSEGLLILSNDGQFIDQMLNPKNEKEKIYWSQVENIPSEDSLDKLRAGGIKIENYKTAPARVQIIYPEIPARNPPIRERKTVPTSWIELAITEGKNRQVRKMTASINHPTLRLIRVKVGDFELGNLKSGEWVQIKKSDLL